MRILRPIFISAAAVVSEASEPGTGEQDCKCKPSELPIYTKEPICKPQEVCETEPGVLETTVGTVRHAFITVFDQARRVTATTEEYAKEALKHTEGTIAYLREEENVVPRYGAVAIGGVSGFIFGLRGRFIKRFIYTSAGALGIAALCYPAEAKQYSKIGLGYAMIGYNFIVGAKKDDPPLNVPTLPKMPGSLSEAWDNVKSFGQSNTASIPDKEMKEVNNPKPSTSPVNPSESCTTPISNRLSSPNE